MLTVQKAREILGETQMNDDEVKELINTVYVFCNKFLDDYFARNDTNA